MAKPMEPKYAFICSPSQLVNPVTRATSAGTSAFISRLSGFSMEASRLSTGLIRYCLTLSNSSADTLPKRPITLAVATAGRSPWVSSCTHWAAESARWSYWPGRYSMANTWYSSGRRKSSPYTASILGSDKMVRAAAANCSCDSPETSYRFKMRTSSRPWIPRFPFRSESICCASISNPCFFSTNTRVTMTSSFLQREAGQRVFSNKAARGSPFPRALSPGQKSGLLCQPSL